MIPARRSGICWISQPLPANNTSAASASATTTKIGTWLRLVRASVRNSVQVYCFIRSK